MVKFIGNKPIFARSKALRGSLLVLVSSLFISNFFTQPTTALDYEATITTNNNITIDASSLNDGTSISHDTITVTSTCRAGYNLFISTSSSDNNLYLNGDPLNNTNDQYYTPSDGINTLANSTNRWGFLLSDTTPSSSSIFQAVPTTGNAATIKTPVDTASETDIDETFPIYFGLSTSSSLPAGTYKMPQDNNQNNGSIVYSLLMSTDCATTLDVTFNKNLDGEGGETGEDTTANFPSPSDNTLDTTTNTLTLSNKVPTRDGYVFIEWNTEADGTGTTYHPEDTIAIGIGEDELVGALTLYAIWGPPEEKTYTLTYDAGDGTDAPDPETATSYSSSYSFTITDSAPIYYGYTFTGWTETANSSTIDYTSGDTINVASTGTTTNKTLYPVYTANSCPAGKICYFDNGADVLKGGRNTMANQTASNNASINLVPTNYSKTGYGFAGWAETANSTPYGPNATITTGNLSSAGLSLYAKWIKTTDTLQAWNSCGKLAAGNVIALTDNRDNQAYAVAKLADGNCWLVENLRLVPSQVTFSTENTHNPTSNFISEATSSSTSNSLCGTDNDATCINQIQFNTNSLNRTLTQSYNTAGNNVAWYSYGVYYNWYTATAGNGTTSNGSNSTVNGDICPKNWHLPTGNNGEFVALGTALGGSYDSNLRAYPVNLLRSGDYNKTSRTNAQTNGRYWTSTSSDSGNAYRGGFQDNKNALNATYRKWDAFTVRCIFDGDRPVYDTVTVNMDANVTSITFVNANNPTQTVTTTDSTVSLRRDAEYTITATLNTGYILNAWSTTANGTLGSTTTNPTTYTVTDTATLTVTAQAIPTYTTTVNMDSGITSVSFTNADYPTQTATPSSNTVALRHGAPYTITATIASGYEFANWSTTANGTLGSTTTNPTTYTVTDTATLTVASQVIPPMSSCTSSPTLSTIATGVIYMQDINSTNRATILNSITIGDTYQIKDSRDDETYCIGKLADGNLWLLDNLAIDLTDNSILNSLSSNNTNITSANESAILASLKNGNRNAGNQYATGPVEDIITGGTTYSAARVSMTNKTRIPSDSISTTGGYRVGGHYNYCAASAGSYCYGNGTADWGTPSGNTTSDICPKNWRLPGGGQTYDISATPPTGEYKNLYSYYNNINTFRQALHLPRSGRNDNIGNTGSFWSSTIHPTSGMGFLYDTGSTIYPYASESRDQAMSVRCLLANTISAITVSLDSHIESVTFTDPSNNTQTATSANPTVSLVQGQEYTITATIASGYEFANWSTTANGTLGSTTTNPTTYTVSDTTTLTAAAQAIPTYTTTVNMDSGITSVSFTNADYPTQTATPSSNTVTLRRGVSYTITATIATGYEFSSWSTTANGTLGSTTTNPTTYTITSSDTLSVTSTERDCLANTICYMSNGANVVGVMGDQTITSSDTTATLYAPNYSRSGYGFAGWNTSSNGTGTSYGPNEPITFTAGQYSSSGLKLYAKWIASTGNLQSWNGCSNLNIGDVTALTDQRDNDTYAIAKLADGECWMIENLRISDKDKNNNTTILSSSNTNNPSLPLINDYTNNITSNHLSSTSANWNTSSISEANINQSRLNTDNTILYQNNISGSQDGNIYSYGNYYNWYSTTAGHGVYSKSSGSTSGDICPTNWHIPTGGDQTTEFAVLDIALGGDGEDDYDGTEEARAQMQKWTKYPNNFVYSGSIFEQTLEYRSYVGRYWSSTAANSYNSYNLSFGKYYSGTSQSYVYENLPGTYNYSKYFGWTARCIINKSTHSVTISPDSNIESITFTNGGDIQTATATNPTVTLKENTPYIITANYVPGYELTSWSTTSGGTLSSTTTNPAIYTITNSATLSTTSQEIPTYTVTVNKDSGITSISFSNSSYPVQTVTTTGSTITLRRGVPYTVTASLINDFAITSWTTTNGNVSSSSSNPTTYTISNTDTLTATSAERNCPANTICYMKNGNDVAGNMGNQSISSSATSTTLYASNFSRSGYGFAGWNTLANNTGTNYGPMEDITFTAGQYSTSGLKLYAKWVASSGNLQSWTGCKNLSIGDVTALTDQRDSSTYAVAKLADNKCWLIENLKLADKDQSNNPVTISSANTNNPNSSFTQLSTPVSPSSTAWCKTDSASCDNQSMLATNNTSSRASNPTTMTTNIYSYGNYYNWYAATSGRGVYSTSGANAAGDICPLGWHLPTGGGATAEYGNLDKALGGTGSKQSTTAASNRWRKYPNNFVRSGYVYGSSIYRTQSSYWSSTATSNSQYAYGLNMDFTYVDPGTYPYDNKYLGRTIRCVASIPSYPVTVSLDSHVTSVTFTNATYGTQTATSSSNTVSLRENTPYTITATTAAGYEFSSWTAGANSTLGSTTANPTTYTVTDTSTLSLTSADNSILINYNGNGLYYNDDPANTVNQVTYTNTTSTTTRTITRYSHTSNINDSGTASGNYANNLQTKDVVTIPGASNLNVTLYYSTEASWDYVYVFKGTYTGSVSKNMSAGQLKTYNGGAKTTFAQATKATFTVSGDTATFAFYSDTSNTYYGYYAIITADVAAEVETIAPLTGTYATPSSSQTHTFLGWSENQNATTATYANEQDIKDNSNYTHADSPVTLYAIYETYSTVTVNLDSGISSIGFYNSNYDTQQVSTNGGTVTLRDNIEYIITASTNPNYYFKNWAITSGGVVGSTTNNPTTLIVTGDSTLTVITEPPYVIAYNPNGGTGSMENQTVPEDAEVNLLERSFIAPSTTSFINANNDTITGEEGKLWLFWGWNTEIDGTGDWYKDKEAVTNLATSGDTITLYAQWRQATIEDLTTGTPIGNEKTIDHNLMQDMSPEACYNSNITSSGNAPAATLLDYRGKVTTGNNPESPEQYTVSKLADGNCWMTKNLNLGRDDGAGPNNNGTISLTPDDTDIKSNFTLPASTTTSSTTTTAARIRTTNNNGNTDNGAYYSWPAAVAYTASTNTNPTTSICPKNWDLPTNVQYTNLNTKSSYSSSNPTTNNPSAFILGGGFTNGATFYQTANSYYWTSTSYNSSQAYGTIVRDSSIGSSSSTGTTYGGNKYYEKSIRCIASRGKVTIVYDGNGSAEYPVTGTTATQENIELNVNYGTANNGFTRNGWYFNSWNTAPDGNGIGISANSSITSNLENLVPGSTITLYAKWLPQYTITYVNNCKTYASSDINCTANSSAATSEQTINLNASGSGSGTLGAYNKFTLANWKIDQWTTNADGTGDSYPVSTNYSISNTNIPSGITLYAHWIPTYTVQYDGNGADNASTGMGSLDTSTGHKSVRHDNLVENDTFDLFASNYKRNGYGFVGWSLDRDAWTKLTDDDVANDVRIWGPNETFTTPSSDNQIITLYAIWAPAETISGNPVYLQNWNGCSALTATTYNSTTGSLAVSKNSIVALTDQRDNEIYTIAKLADGNCWMVDNLRLSTAGTTGNNINDPSVTNQSLSEGYGDSFIGLANPETSNFSNSTTSNSLYSTTIITGSNQGYRFPRYNEQNKTWNNNAASAITPTQIQTVASVNAHTDFNNYVYSYGNYYTWAAAIANISDYTSSNAHTDVQTSICPTGWHLPYGNTGNSGTNLGNTDGGYYNLANKMSATGDNRISSNKFRMFPNNFIFSGYSSGYRGGSGYYWSTSASSTNYAYRFYIGSANITPGNNSLYKYYGSSVRCVTEPPYYTTTVNIEGDGIISATISDGINTQTISNSGDTVSLKAGTPYQVTVDKPVNYEASWNTSENGVLSSTTIDSATYQVTGNATLTITGIITPSYEVTVTFDEHVSSVSFYHPDLGTQNVTTNGQTVNLYRGVDYIIAASFTDGYTLNTWATTAGGTIDSPISLATTYTITGSTTLSVTSETPGSITSFTPATCASLSVGDTVELTDLRDDSVYKVSKLADNNCWMLDNLRLDLTDSSVQSNLNSSTTNATNNTLDYLKGTKTGTALDRYPTAAAAISSARSYSVPNINTTYKDTVASTTYGNGSGKIGTYYNYCAASAGSYCYGNGTSTTGTPSSDPNTSTLMDVTEDICPAGWRMPTSDANGEYQALYNAYSTASEGQALGFKNALSTPLSGYFDNNSISSQGTYGDFWSSTYYYSSYMYRLYETTTAVTPSSYGYRYDGYPVRCILGAPSFSNVTVNLDANTDIITFTNPTYGTITVTPDNNTVELRQGVEYTITANIPSVAYDFASWSTSGDVTIGSTTTNPTAFTINGDSTLSVSTAEKPSYEVTVNIDEHVRSVAFYQDTLGVQQVTTSGNTVSLRHGVEYIMTATFEENYSTGTWTTTENGTIGSTILPATTYTVAGPATLSLTSKSKTGSTTLLPGEELNAKMKTLAEGRNMDYGSYSSKIKSLQIANALPADFTPSTANTVSVANSEKPIYIFFDNTNDAGIMYFYTDAKDIYMNADSSSAFENNFALANIDGVSGWDTGSVTDMGSMFANARALTNIDGASNWNTGSVTNMSHMFHDAFALTNIDGTRNWNTSSVINMSNMFNYATALTNIDGASNWNTGSVTNMSYMFYETTALTNIDGASNWNTSNVTDMSYMFYETTALANIDGVSGWDTGSVTDMGSMFANARALTNIDGATNWNTSNVTDMSGMFYCTFALTNIDGVSGWDTGSVTDMGSMFDNARALTDIDALAHWDTSSVTDMSSMFHYAFTLANIDGASGWDTGSVTDMRYMFYSAFALTNINGASNWNTSSVTDMKSMFFGARALTNIDGASGWNTSNVTDMSYMFWYASALTNINGARNWDTSHVTNMNQMFYYARALTNIDGASNWNTGSVTNMSYMFYDATALTNINGASNWDTSSVTDMSYMFWYASALTNIDGASGWDTSSVTNMSYMFQYANALTNINGASGWDTSSVTNMSYMFQSAIALTNINGASGWDTSSVTNMSYMFQSAIALTNINGTRNWDIDKVANFSSMFSGAPSHVNFNIRSGTWNTSGTFTPVSIADSATITINPDSHVMSITFSNATHGTRTIVSGETISLAKNTEYTITAVYESGYTIDSWTSTSGIIGSATSLSTTYQVASDDTLSITSTPASTSTVTLDIDSNVSSVSFSNPYYDTVTLTNDNDSTALVNDLDYSIIIKYNDGYTGSISTSSNGTIGSTTIKGITYTVNGTDTLTITTTEKTGTATLDTGRNLNSKMKTIARGKSADYGTISSEIKSLQMASFLPSDFTPSTANTVSVANSEKPIYIFFDNTNDTGIMYFYTDAKDIYMNADSSSAFYYNTALTDISAVSGWKTNNVTNMGGMFIEATALTNIDSARNWDTSSVTDMGAMFSNATALTNIDALANWDTGNVTDMGYMFSHASALTNIDGATNWNTGNVTNMSGMFFGAHSLTNIDGASNWDTSNVTNMNQMFYDASALTNIDGASGWNTGSVTDMSDMFRYAIALTNIDGASGWDTSSVTNMSYMFAGFKEPRGSAVSALTNINGASNWDTSNVTNMSYMFYNAAALTNINGASNWNTGSVTNMSYMFYEAAALTNIDGASNWNTGSVTNMSYMFYDAYALTNIDGASNWNTGSVTNMSYMFYDATALTNIDGASGWDTGSVTDMSYMFYSAYALTNINGASNWGTSNVTSMSNMFYEATALTNINGASNWGTSNVTSMSNMFYNATALTNIDGASGWDTGSVTDMSYMFYSAYALTNIDGASNWDTSNVTNMNQMFYSARALTNIDSARNWDTSSVTDMGAMFFNDRALTNIDGARNWNTGSVTDMREMFYSITALTDAPAINNWDVRAVTASSGSSTSSSNKFYHMFYSLYSNSYPNFTKRSGTWNSEGTFIPDDTTVPTNSAVYVTVNFDEHVRSVGFYNSTYGTQQVTTSGNNVRIAKNTQYTISSSYDDGYTISHWSTTANGTLGSTTTSATTYTVTDTTTLSVTSQLTPANSINNSSPILSNSAPVIDDTPTNNTDTTPRSTPTTNEPNNSTETTESTDSTTPDSSDTYTTPQGVTTITETTKSTGVNPISIAIATAIGAAVTTGSILYLNNKNSKEE